MKSYSPNCFKSIVTIPTGNNDPELLETYETEESLSPLSFLRPLAVTQAVPDFDAVADRDHAAARGREWAGGVCTGPPIYRDPLLTDTPPN